MKIQLITSLLVIFSFSKTFCNEIFSLSRIRDSDSIVVFSDNKVEFLRKNLLPAQIDTPKNKSSHVSSLFVYTKSGESSYSQFFPIIRNHIIIILDGVDFALIVNMEELKKSLQDPNLKVKINKISLTETRMLFQEDKLPERFSSKLPEK